MDQQQCLQLIEEYRSYPIMWNRSCKSYHNKTEREDAWREIAASLQLPLSELKSKMKILMGTYRSERSREKNKCRVSGSAYTSKWFAYEALRFLDNKLPLNADQNITKTEVDDDDEERDESEPNQGVEETRERPPIVLSLLPASKPLVRRKYSKIARGKGSIKQKSTPKKRKLDEADGESNSTSNALDVPRTSPATNDEHDEVTSFFAFVAAKVKKYPSRTRNAVEHAIFDILKKADAGVL